ncbi:LPD29 domain-containing protein [Burkholderia glumae]
MLNRSVAAPARRVEKEAAVTAVQQPLPLVTVLTLVDTAQLVQKILGEAFPSRAFAVSLHSTTAGTLLDVSWTDGPRADQVGRFVHPLQARRLANGGRAVAVEHFTLTPAGYHTVRLAADRISLYRVFSDAAVERALSVCERRYRGRLSPDDREAMTVERYRAGALCGVEIEGVHRAGGKRTGGCLQSDVDEILCGGTDVTGFPRSPTAAALFARSDVH